MILEDGGIYGMLLSHMAPVPTAGVVLSLVIVVLNVSIVVLIFCYEPRRP
jgi:hypothetical protein